MSINESALHEDIEQSLDYSGIVQSVAFQQLLREKRRFIIPWSIFFLAFYFALPILTAYSSVLNKAALGSISWAWIYGLAQFIVTWVLCMVYAKRAAKFDRTVETIKQSVSGGGS